jgi:DNA-binding NarL/FixJ family response regulator
MTKKRKVQTTTAASSSPVGAPEPTAATVALPIRVAIIEDNPDMRRQLRRLFSESSGYECVSDCPSAESALESLPAIKPEVVLMDINLPGLDGIECVRQLKLKLPGTVFIMLTVYENTERIFQAVQAGASGYLLKRIDPSDLLRAVQEARSGGAPMTSFIARKVLDAFRTQLPKPAQPSAAEELSAREREVLEKLAKGLLVKEIAAQLGVSYSTVRTYTLRIYEKLHVRSRSQAAALYYGTQNRVPNQETPGKQRRS